MSDTKDTPSNDHDIREAVRERYGSIAREGASCCAPSPAPATGSCCAPAEGGSSCGCGPTAEQVGEALGYSADEMASIPEEANLGLGCGNPTALAELQPGETVLDLGSGGGIDCFLAREEVGETGHVIGVDMTPDMLDLARKNAERQGLDNVEFRMGEIEHLPVEDASIDIIMSNCVVNLSPDKPQVFREAYRVLVPGGRLMLSDIVLDAPLPEEVAASVDAYTACIAGAALRDDYLGAILDAGFEGVEVMTEREFDVGVEGLSGVTSITVKALKQPA